MANTMTYNQRRGTEFRNGFLLAAVLAGLVTHSWIRPPQTPTSNRRPPLALTPLPPMSMHVLYAILI